MLALHIIIISNVGLLSQNLLLNGDFEEFYPDFSSCYQFDPMLIDSFPAKDWLILNNSTPDYYHQNNVLQNLAEFQRDRQLYPQLYEDGDAYSGKAWIGLILFRWDGYLEQITGFLSYPLMKDSIYEVSFAVKICAYSYFCLNDIGIRFSKKNHDFSEYLDPYYVEMYDLPIKADIEFDISRLCSSMNWITFKGIYEAKGGENRITIGYFFQDDFNWKQPIRKYQEIWPKGKKHEDRFYRKQIKNNSKIGLSECYIDRDISSYRLAYYFLDDVKIIPINSSLN